MHPTVPNRPCADFKFPISRLIVQLDYSTWETPIERPGCAARSRRAPTDAPAKPIPIDNFRTPEALAGEDAANQWLRDSQVPAWPPGIAAKSESARGHTGPRGVRSGSLGRSGVSCTLRENRLAVSAGSFSQEAISGIENRP